MAGGIISDTETKGSGSRIHSGILFFGWSHGNRCLLSGGHLWIYASCDSWEHAAWRYTLISGVIPAIPLMIIRPFLPESTTWKKKKDEGTLKRPSFAELFQSRIPENHTGNHDHVCLRLRRSFRCDSTSASNCSRASGSSSLPKPQQQQVVSGVQAFQEIGGLIGRFLLAFLAVRILSRRKLVRIFQIPGLIIIPLVFLFPAVEQFVNVEVGCVYRRTFDRCSI